MPKSIQGVYRDGKIELAEVPHDVQEDTPVIVTFLESEQVDLRERGIDESQATDLRARLSAFSEEWGSPDMDAYDDYDDAKSRS